jgi:coronin-1B/1C/6
LASKGTSNIKYYDIGVSGSSLNFLSEYTGGAAQGALGLLPKRMCNVNTCEVAKFLKVTGTIGDLFSKTLAATSVDTISFQVPRKVRGFLVGF